MQSNKEKFNRTASYLEHYAKQFRDMSNTATNDDCAEALNIINSLQTNLGIQGYINQLLKSSEK